MPKLQIFPIFKFMTLSFFFNFQDELTTRSEMKSLQSVGLQDAQGKCRIGLL